MAIQFFVDFGNKIVNFVRTTVCCVIRDIFYFRISIFIVCLPILFLPLITELGSPESKCLYVIIIMSLFWITETLPLPVTSLIPLFMFPLLGIMPAKKLALQYVQDPTFLFMGGYLLALAIEFSQFHLRIALGALLLVGSDLKWILLCSMLTTGFLSMWMTNVATTAMTLPIIKGLLTELIKDRRIRLEATSCTNEIEMDTNDNYSSESKAPREKDFQLIPTQLNSEELKICKMFYLSICYSANIGGISTLTGTGTNIIAVGLVENRYGPNTSLNFATWMGFGIPLAILNLFCAWFLLLAIFNGLRNSFSCVTTKNENVSKVIREHYNSLGSIKVDQYLVLFFFIILIFLWIFRSPKFVTGWGDYFLPGYVTDATAAMLIAFLLFIVPSELPDFLCSKGREKKNPPILRKSILIWSEVQEKFPWGLILLIGGSLAMASAIEESGLSKILGQALSSLDYLSAPTLCVIASCLATFSTEIVGNLALVSVLTPILTIVAENLKINPLYFIIPTTVCVSYAFMLPVATASNALVFGAGFLRVIDMVKTGFLMNCISIALTLLATHTWGIAIFDLNTFPDWVSQKNNSSLFNNSLQLF